ncbi:MAG: CHAT domain-containing protein [Bacteroidota bacterium]
MPKCNSGSVLCLILCLLLSSFVQGQDWDELNREGMNAYASGSFVQSRSTHVKALTIAERQYGRQSLQYTSSLSNLAYAQKALGDFEPATANFLEAARISQFHYGPTSFELFESQLNVVNIYLNRRLLDSTEFYILQARQTLKSAQNVTPDYFKDRVSDFYRGMIGLFNSEASLYYSKGLTMKAIEIMESLKLMLKEDIQYNPDLLSSYLSALNNLGTYYLEVGALEKAQKSIHEFIELTNPNEDPIQHLYALQSLGSICRELGIYDSAQLVWEQGLEFIVSEKLVNSDLNMVFLNNLGELHFEREDYKAAKNYFHQSKSQYESRPSYDPERYRTTLFNLAQSYWFDGEYPTADILFDQAMKNLLNQILKNFTFLTDTEKRAFYRRNLSFIQDYSSFALEMSGVVKFSEIADSVLKPEISGDLYNLQLNTKGIILNASNKMRKRILSSNDEVLMDSYKKWENQKNELAQSYGDRSQSEIDRLENSIEFLEKLLVKQSAAFETGFQIDEYTWKDIQRVLKPGEAAVEMIRLVDGLLYGALIVTPETRDHPVFAIVKSKKSKYLEKEFYRQYLNSIKFKLKDTVSYSVYWEPILDSIQSSVGRKKLKRIYFSSDGIYNQINLNTLINTKTDQYVVDEVSVVRLINTKELLVKKIKKGGGKDKKAALFGMPSFSLADEVFGPFVELQGTGVEIKKISSTLQEKGWKVSSHLEERASETNLKVLGSHDIVHLATHGFFYGIEQDQADPNITEVLLNSGVALAGANHKEGHLNEDGILTAYETTTLPLDSTQLVVLSACETGLGQYHPGEGVYGLQRSLKSAGAKNIVMSLWKVDDLATQKLMIDFYRNWLSGNEIREAFREAQIELRKTYPEPYYWGAFVMSGL